MGAAEEVLDETMSLSDALRRLWADHVIWTRQYIVAALSGASEADAAAGRLLRNQEDIGMPSSRSTGKGQEPSSPSC